MDCSECETCWHYDYDEEYDEYYCMMDLDEDEVYRFFATKQNAELLWNADGTPTARTGKILAATPMGRFGKPEELLGALGPQAPDPA